MQGTLAADRIFEAWDFSGDFRLMSLSLTDSPYVYLS
jgi:hypothetical protein